MPNPNGGLFSAFLELILSQKTEACQPDFVPNLNHRFPKGENNEKNLFNSNHGGHVICHPRNHRTALYAQF